MALLVAQLVAVLLHAQVRGPAMILATRVVGLVVVVMGASGAKLVLAARRAKRAQKAVRGFT